jgi:ATP-dependent Clp protease ATP-binding subunit ClpC
MEIAGAGFDPEYGARPLRRVIQNSIQDTLSEMILSNRFVAGDTIEIDYGDVQKEDGTTKKEFIFNAIDHREVELPEDEETTAALEAMLS